MTGLPLRIELRPGQMDDIDAVIALERAIESAPHWDSSIYAEILRSSAPYPRRHLIVATGSDGIFAGFAVASVHPVPGNPAELESVAVAAHARRAGIGRALCEALFQWCQDQGAIAVALEVRESNTAAIGLYASMGFAQIVKRPGYYAHPADDAVILHKVLIGSSS